MIISSAQWGWLLTYWVTQHRQRSLGDFRDGNFDWIHNVLTAESLPTIPEVAQENKCSRWDSRPGSLSSLPIAGWWLHVLLLVVDFEVQVEGKLQHTWGTVALKQYGTVAIIRSVGCLVLNTDFRQLEKRKWQPQISQPQFKHDVKVRNFQGSV